MRRHRPFVDLHLVFLSFILFTATLQFIIYSAAIAGSSSEIFLLRERNNYSTPRGSFRLAENSFKSLSIASSENFEFFELYAYHYIHLLTLVWLSLQILRLSIGHYNFRHSCKLFQTLLKLLLISNKGIDLTKLIPIYLNFPHSIVGKGNIDNFSKFSSLETSQFFNFCSI